MALSEKIYCKPTVVTNSKLVDSSDDVILLVIKIDEKLTFSQHIYNYSVMLNISYLFYDKLGNFSQ